MIDALCVLLDRAHFPNIRQSRIIIPGLHMLTGIETETLQRYAADIWSDSEREAFIT